MKVNWIVSKSFEDYEFATNKMLEVAEGIHKGESAPTIWLLEHSHMYSAGTSAHPSQLLRRDIPVYKSSRGGKYTYHGPGQRVIYVMLDLALLGKDIKKFINHLQEWIILTLKDFGVDGFVDKDNVGVWVMQDDKPHKIAAIGVRVRKWVTMHGIAVNINPDLSMFKGIVPCGISDFGVTSLFALKKDVTFQEFDRVLKEKFYKVFNI